MFGLKSSSRIKTSVERNWRAIRSTYLVSNFRAVTRKHSLSRIVLVQSSILTIATYRCTIITLLVHWRRKCIVDAQNMNTQSTALSSPVGRSLTGGDHILKLGHVSGRCGKRRKHRVSKVDAFCMQWSLYPGYQGFFFSPAERCFGVTGRQIFGRRLFVWATIKTLRTPETEHEKSLAPRGWSWQTWPVLVNSY